MKGKILVVDDDPDILRLTRYCLEIEGCEVVTAETGTDGLFAVKRERPDLVILDVMMPDMSGLEVCRRLRANPQTADLPIVMLSAKGQVQDKVGGLKGGADDYVTKPADPTELLARVESLLLRAARARPAGPRSQLLALVGAKGGVGTTTVAVNLALALVELEQSVILVDLHPHAGCVCPMLGLESTHGLNGLAQMDASTILPRQIENRLSSHHSGLRVLCDGQAPSLANGDGLDPARAEAIVGGLTTMADRVLFDLPVELTPASRVVLGRCDSVALVSEPDPLALRCAKERLALLQQCGVMGRQIGVIIVSRFPSSMTMTVSELQALLGTTIVAVIPPAAEACSQALNQGRPLFLAAAGHFAVEMVKTMAVRLVQSPLPGSGLET